MGFPVHWAMVILISSLLIFYLTFAYWDRTFGKFLGWCRQRWAEWHYQRRVTASIPVFRHPGTSDLIPPRAGTRTQWDRTGTHEVELVEDVEALSPQAPDEAARLPRFWQFWRRGRRSSSSMPQGEPINLQVVLPQTPARCLPTQTSGALHVGRVH